MIKQNEKKDDHISVVKPSKLSSSILVVGPAWVGDMVMAQSLFKALRAEDHSLEIDVLAPTWAGPLLARMPEVRQAIALPFGHGELRLINRWTIGRQLRTASYQRAIILPRSAKSAVIPWVADIPVRTGYLGEHRYGLLNDIRPLDKNSVYRTVDRFVALAQEHKPAGANAKMPTIKPPQITSTAAQQKEVQQALGLEDTRPILTLCPGAEYGSAKRWPPEYFAALARDYLALNWQVWLMGSSKDAPITQSIAQQASGVVDLAGKTSLAQAVDLLAASRVVVSNDSGLMHVAAAAGVSVVALYGSSDPQYTPPLSDEAEVLYRGLACSPCFARQCPLGHLNCLRDIRPSEVTIAVNQISMTLNDAPK
jgi:heptosyltransferase-2